MAQVKLLIDTDIFIDYLNAGFLSTILESKSFEIYYSVVTKKELLSKRGLKEAERQAILLTLKRYRIIHSITEFPVSIPTSAENILPWKKKMR